MSLTQESITTFDARLFLANLLKRLQAVNARHQHIEQNEIGLQALFDFFKSFFAGGRGFNFVVVDLKQGLDIAQHARFIIDQQDFGSLLHRIFPLCWRRQQQV